MCADREPLAAAMFSRTRRVAILGAGAEPTPAARIERRLP